MPVDKPNSQAWIRVHPDQSYRLDVAVVEIKESRHIYLVEPGLAPELGTEIAYVTLFTAMTRDGNSPFLWPVKLPNPDGRPDAWRESAREAAVAAMTNWVRVKANMGVRAYEYWVAPANLAEPQWPQLPFVELLRLGFKGDRFIDSLEHPLVARLRGTM